MIDEPPVGCDTGMSLTDVDPVKGATFEQYAWTRVAGGMIDELRRLDWAPRRLRKRWYWA